MAEDLLNGWYVDRGQVMITTRSHLDVHVFSGPLPARLASSDDTLLALSPRLIQDCLILYPEDHIYLNDLRYESGLLLATVLPHEIDYSTITVDYYTATQIVMITSQMAYILGGCIIHDPEFKDLGPELYASYLQLLSSGQLYYARMNMKLKRKTSNKSPVQTTMQVLKTMRRNSMNIMQSRLELGRTNAVVDVMLVMDRRRISQ